MIIYSLPELKYLANNLCKRLGPTLDISQGKNEFARYANGEWHANIHEKVSGLDCAIIGAFTPPDDQLIKSLVLAHTLKKDGANNVTAIIPYFAYMRHDKNIEYESFITDWIGKISTVSGFDKIITIDIHSEKAESLIKIPIVNLSPVDLFLAQINENDLANVSIVAPDEGATKRAENFARAAGVSRPVVYLKKTRLKAKITHTELVGELSDNVIIVDDILDTGGTLISCAKQLKKRGVKRITIVVTHGLFSGKKWQKLFKLNVKKIITTDSTPSSFCIKNKKIKIVSCAALLAKIIKKDI